MDAEPKGQGFASPGIKRCGIFQEPGSGRFWNGIASDELGVNRLRRHVRKPIRSHEHFDWLYAGPFQIYKACYTPNLIDEDVALVEISEVKDERASAERSVENGLVNRSHRRQHRELMRTVGKIVDNIGLVPKAIVVVPEYIDHVRVNGCVCVITRGISWNLFGLQKPTVGERRS